ncbi:nuclear transport factor 2 family protein [Nocardia salmonicida]
MHTNSTSHQVVRRYFQMWNSGDTSIAPQVLAPGWTDHAHPEINGYTDVQHAVEQTRAARPGLRFHIDSILDDGHLLAVVGGVGYESCPDTADSRIIWLVRLTDSHMVEMWTYSLNTP